MGSRENRHGGFRPKSTVRMGDQSEVDGCSLIAKLSIGFSLRRASVSLALNPPIYFMLAPVNSLAIGECSALWRCFQVGDRAPRKSSECDAAVLCSYQISKRFDRCLGE